MKCDDLPKNTVPVALVDFDVTKATAKSPALAKTTEMMESLKEQTYVQNALNITAGDANFKGASTTSAGNTLIDANNMQTVKIANLGATRAALSLAIKMASEGKAGRKAAA